MENDEIELSDDEPLVDEGWRNSLAPNDGYYPQNRHRAKMSDRGVSSRLAQRNTSRISMDLFNSLSYRMIRRMRNPKPNAPDHMMYKIWTTFGFYLPVTAIVSVNMFFNYFSILLIQCLVP